MSLSQVPSLTPGAWGMELELEPELQLHQQTLGNLMVNTHIFTGEGPHSYGHSG